MPVVARPAQHDIFVVYLAREGYTVAVVWQQGILKEMELFEIGCITNPDGWSVKTIAPHDVITVLDPTYARVILVIAESAFWISIDPLDDGIVQFPIDPVLAEAAMHIHIARLVIAPEYPCELAIEWHYRTIEDTIG